MDTKWKNKKIIIIAILLFSFGVSVLFSSVMYGRDLLRGDFFQTGMFNEEYSQFIHELSVYELVNISQAELKNRITVTKEEIEEHRYKFGDLSEQITSIKNQYESKISDAESVQNKEVADIYRKERDAKIEDITLNFKSDEHIYKKILEEKQEQIDRGFAQMSRDDEESLQYYLNTFDYYFEDINTGKVYTSLSSGEAKEFKDVFTNKNMRFIKSYGYQNEERLVVNDDPFISTLFSGEDINWNSFGESKVSYFKGYVGIPKNASANYPIVRSADNYEEIKTAYLVLLGLGAVMLIISLILYRKGNPFKEANFQSPLYNKIPSDIRWFILIVSAMVSFLLFVENNYQYYSGMYFKDFSFTLLMSVLLCTLGVAVTVFQVILLWNVTRDRGLIEEICNHSLAAKLLKAIRAAFLFLNVGIQLVVLLGIVFCLGAIFSYIAFINYLEPIDLLVFAGCSFIIGMPMLLFIFRYAGYLNTIVKNVNGLAAGRNEPDLEIKGRSIFAELAKGINVLKHGVKVSQREQVKSERLKTELITNVSHDLRTPLTSIITYTDLLKGEELTEEDRQNYLEIIDRKSKRLKVLIDDLFEASKMATGNIELNKKKVEIVQLLQQALAEHDEKIAQSGLHFRVTHGDPPIYAIVDGQKLWRVFDNLIGNILKYSLPSTRVYISVRDLGNQVDISFKNVSQFELGDNVDELFERFKRGDKSRHTEGSGLGLAIAKSIIDLHGGEMEIDVDGDLFKATIRLNKE